MGWIRWLVGLILLAGMVLVFIVMFPFMVVFITGLWIVGILARMADWVDSM